MKKHISWKRVGMVYLLLLVLSHGFQYIYQPKIDIPATYKSISIHGDRIAYKEIGIPDKDKPSLLLIHGSPLASRSFIQIENKFPDRHILIPDLPGFGFSEKEISDYSIRSHAEYIGEWIEKFPDSNFHILGYSMGGGVALELSKLKPNKIDSLTLLSSIGVQEYELLGSYELNHALHGLQLAAINLLTYATPHFGYYDKILFNRSYALNFYQSDQRPLRAILLKWDKPMLIIHGKSDSLIPSSIVGEHKRLVPQAEVELLEGGHGILFERNNSLSEILNTFLNRVDKEKALLRSDISITKQVEALDPFRTEMRGSLTGMPLIIIFLLIALGTFISEDLATISAGIMAANGLITFPIAVAASFAGIFIGDAIIFLSGYFLGHGAIRRKPFSFMFTEKNILKAQKTLKEKGLVIILLTRFLPGTRTITYFTAGVVRTPIVPFLTVFAIASLLWTPFLVGLSYFAGKSLLQIASSFEIFGWPLVLFGILVLFGFIRYILPLSNKRERAVLKARWIQLSRWEFWPWWQLNFPVILYVLYLGIFRYKKLMLFTAVNPALPHSGFVGENKVEILNKLSAFTPPWVDLPKELGSQGLKEKLNELGEATKSNRIVLKPKDGQRGAGVKIFENEQVLEAFIDSLPCDYIAQKYVGGEEFGVFYARDSNGEGGRIISITIKKQVILIGDGKSSLETLIIKHPRACCLAPLFFERFEEELDQVLEKGKLFPLGDLGTHSLGALFLDGNSLITPALIKSVNKIANSYSGFNFGRFDIKAPSIESLQKGEQLSVLEVNGVTSESTHIYDPRHSVFYAWKTLFAQWDLAFQIAEVNVEKGAKVSCFRKFICDVIGSMRIQSKRS